MSTNVPQEFSEQRHRSIVELGNSDELKNLAVEFFRNTAPLKYTYNFDWLGRPIIQLPQDIVAVQEIVWQTRPDLIIETGVAHGGSLIQSASLLSLLDITDAIRDGRSMNPAESERLVVGIDIDIRSHNRKAIEAHPMASRIRLLQGSSISSNIVGQVSEIAAKYNRVMVCLDSNHTHEHVLAELEAYAPLTTVGCYCIVFDTIVEDMPKDFYPDRPWGPGDNPKTAVWEYLKNHSDFEIDKAIQSKLLLTVAPDGYLRRVAK